MNHAPIEYREIWLAASIQNKIRGNQIDGENVFTEPSVGQVAEPSLIK